MSEQKSRTVNHSEAMVIARAKSTGAGRRLVGGEWLFSHDELVRFHDLLIATGMSEAATLCEGEAAEYLRNVWPPHEPPQPAEATECRYCDEVMKERDSYHDTADQLANGIAAYLGIDIGEHSSGNFPWENAIEAIEAADFNKMSAPVEPNVVQKIMARLADLLDEDQFNEIESMALNAGIHPPPEPQGWQPIETAPRDTPILLSIFASGDPERERLVVVGGSSDGVTWIDHYDYEIHPPTHWMPLPAPPLNTGAGE